MSSAFLVGLYAVLKYTDIDQIFGLFYQCIATFVGFISIDFVVSTIAWNALLIPNTSVDKNMVPSSRVGIAAGLICTVGYFSTAYLAGGSPESFYALSLFNNLIAVSIALQAIGLIQV